METLSRERAKHFVIPLPLGFYPTIALKVCFHLAALPPPTVVKEKARDKEKSKESEYKQLARRGGGARGRTRKRPKIRSGLNNPKVTN